MIIHLISSPRNVSTALMYSFANRADTQVIDEPFYSYYLNHSGADHPGREDIIASQPTNPLQVISDIASHNRTVEHLFIKNMAHHIIDMKLDFLLDYCNVFLIRDPKQQIASFAEVIEKPMQSDIGIERQFQIYEYLKSRNQKIIILDSGILLQNPELVLNSLCSQCNISMSGKMLQWEYKSLDEDGVWAKYWYDNVHRSTGFSKQKTSDRPLPDDCHRLYEESLVYYNQLLKLAIH